MTFVHDGSYFEQVVNIERQKGAGCTFRHSNIVGTEVANGWA